jgi:hypothetical protein
MSAQPADWRYRLRGDPATWLLDETDNASVFFWFQRDIVGRPEDSPALVEAHDQILFSTPVQDIFAAQDPNGYWESPTSLDLPRYRATLWALALLAELGLAPSSRRAQMGCEFIIQEHLNADGAFTGLRDLQLSGLALRTLLYFKGTDSRLAPALDRIAPAAADGDLYALWALVQARDEKYRQEAERGATSILNALALNRFTTMGVFPSFDPGDSLLALRLLALLGHANDTRAVGAIERLWGRQLDGARWVLETSYDGMLPTRVEPAGVPSKWATLAALRVVTRT